MSLLLEVNLLFCSCSKNSRRNHPAPSLGGTLEGSTSQVMVLVDCSPLPSVTVYSTEQKLLSETLSTQGKTFGNAVVIELQNTFIVYLVMRTVSDVFSTVLVKVKSSSTLIVFSTSAVNCVIDSISSVSS